MSYESMLGHQCDIYHMTSSGKPIGYGVPNSVNLSYPAQPDLTSVPSYWTERSQSIAQGEPNNVIIQTFLVHFLIHTDVRVNDKVVFEGASYILQTPRKIRNHHIEVTAVRNENL